MVPNIVQQLEKPLPVLMDGIMSLRLKPSTHLSQILFRYACSKQTFCYSNEQQTPGQSQEISLEKISNFFFKMCIGNTSGDWRHIVKWGDNAAGNGWSHTGCIYVYPTPQPGTVPFTVSHQVNFDSCINYHCYLN